MTLPITINIHIILSSTKETYNFIIHKRNIALAYTSILNYVQLQAHLAHLSKYIEYLKKSPGANMENKAKFITLYYMTDNELLSNRFHFNRDIYNGPNNVTSFKLLITIILKITTVRMIFILNL